MGIESFRQEIVRYLFSRLYRKGLGNSLPGNSRGVGSATYPWSRMTKILESRGVRVLLNSPVEKIECGARGVTVSAGASTWRADQAISTLPIRNLVSMLSPRSPEPVLTAASELNYRDFIVVALMLKRSHLFPDNWIYVHDPAVQVGRIQNYANWSPKMMESGP